jgi:peptide/nickel transport system permease protein
MTTFLMRRIFQGIIFVVLSSLLIYTALVILMPQGPGARYNSLKQSLRDNGAAPTRPQSQGQPGDPLDTALGKLEKRYKLDKPWPLNFFVWLFDPNDTSEKAYTLQGELVELKKGIDIQLFGLRLRGSGILTGDFGQSEGFAQGTAISELFAARWVNTLLLVGAALALAVLIGIPLGIIGALRQRSVVDHVITFLSLGGLSIPAFVLGLLFIMFMAVLPSALHDQNGWGWLPWLPPGGLGEPGSLTSRLIHLILPAFTLAIPLIARISRHTRFAMLDVLGQDFIRTAWAKGLGRRQVVFKHAFRNTLNPIITQIVLLIPAIVSGSVVVEMVFAYEGMGKAFYRAIGGCLANAGPLTSEPPPCPSRGFFPIDYPFALVLLLLLVLIIAVSNVLGDLLHAMADPRVNYEARGRQN